MAYVCKYSLTVAWIGPNGMGQNNVQLTQGLSAPADGQKLVFFNSSVPGSQTFTSADITAFLNTMTTDLSAQMNAAAPRVQNFSSGGG